MNVDDRVASFYTKERRKEAWRKTTQVKDGN